MAMMEEGGCWAGGGESGVVSPQSNGWDGCGGGPPCGDGRVGSCMPFRVFRVDSRLKNCFQTGPGMGHGK